MGNLSAVKGGVSKSNRLLQQEALNHWIIGEGEIPHWTQPRDVFDLNFFALASDFNWEYVRYQIASNLNFATLANLGQFVLCTIFGPKRLPLPLGKSNLKDRNLNNTGGQQCQRRKCWKSQPGSKQKEPVSKMGGRRVSTKMTLVKHFFCHVQKEPICTYKCRFWIFGRIQNENALLQRLRPVDLHSFGTILLGGLKPRQPVLAEFSRF